MRQQTKCIDIRKLRQDNCDRNGETAQMKRQEEIVRATDSYVAIDIETTGLNPKLEKIIEIGAVKVVEGKVVAEKAVLVNPRRLLTCQIQELTGITDEMLVDAPGIEEVIGEYREFCQGFPLLGHRILFDYSFLKRAAINQGMEFEKQGIDTLALCRKFMPTQERKNLTEACIYYGVKQKGVHRALQDAYSATGLYEELKKKYFLQEPELFLPKTLIYKVKKEQPASKRQKQVLRELLKYHKISLTVQIDSMTRNEVSRMTDKIISQYGRIIKR